MFDKIAGRYDMINTALTAGLHNSWRRKMVAALELQPGDSVLDAGTGTHNIKPSTPDPNPPNLEPNTLSPKP